MHINLCFLHLENDGRARFLLQDAGGAQGLEVRVGVVEEVGVVVDQQRLDVVEDEAELIGVLHRVQAWMVLGHQGGGEAAHAGGVQYFTHLGEYEGENMSGFLEILPGTGCTLHPEMKQEMRFSRRG